MYNEFYETMKMKHIEDKYIAFNKDDFNNDRIDEIYNESEIKEKDQTDSVLNIIKNKLLNIEESFKSADMDIHDIQLLIKFKPFIKTHCLPAVYNLDNQNEVNKYLEESCSEDVYDDTFKLLKNIVYPKNIKVEIGFTAFYNNGFEDKNIVFRKDDIEANVDLDKLLNYINKCSYDIFIGDKNKFNKIQKNQIKDLTKKFVVKSTFGEESDQVLTCSMNINKIKELDNIQSKKAV